MKLSTTILSAITGASALIEPREVTRVTSLRQLETIIKTNPKVSTNFCAEWSGACKSVEAHYHDLSDENWQIAFIYVDIDFVGADEASAKYNFDAIPTFITFKAGNEFGSRVVGPNLGGLDRQIAALAGG